MTMAMECPPLPLPSSPRCHRTTSAQEKSRRPAFAALAISTRHFLVVLVVLLDILKYGSALSIPITVTSSSPCPSYRPRIASATQPTPSLSWNLNPILPRGKKLFIKSTTVTNKRNSVFLLRSSNSNNISVDNAAEDKSDVLSLSEPIATATSTTIQTNSNTLSSIKSSSTSLFGESVPYTPPSSSTTISSNDFTPKLSTSPESRAVEKATDTVPAPNKILIAIASFLLAILHYTYQFTHPTTAISLLSSMEQHSASLLDIGSNGKPTVIDFWAPWCINCRVFAPTLYAIEHEYQDRINFIVVNGDDAKNYPLVQLLGVDAIPHVALLDSEGDVETALIGPISRRVMRADLDALLHQRQLRVASGANGVDCSSGGGGNVGGEKAVAAVALSAVAEITPSQEPALAATTSTTIVCHDDLPYKMYDAFGYRPEESRRIRFR